MHLDELTTEEAQQLLVNIAKWRHQTDLVNFLNTPTGQTRVKAVQHLAGGNPRIYIIFADFLTHQSLEELVSPFMSLVDILTPYYQSRMQYLSAQQRKIVELLCEKKSSIPVKTIAQRCFMTAQTASSQLKELREKGYVRAETIGRDAFYEITEPLMRICLGVKKERGEPLRLMVDFLRVWYPKTELQNMYQALLLTPERFTSMCRYLERAMDNDDLVDNDPRIQAYLDEIKARFDQENYSDALQIAEKLLQVRDSWVERSMYAACLWNLRQYEAALNNAEQAIALNPNYELAWNCRGNALYDLGHYEEAIASFDKALQIKPDYYQAWVNRGIFLNNLERHEEAIASFDKALQLKSDDNQAWNNRGIASGKLGHHEEAIASFNKALQIKSDDHQVWNNRGIAFGKLCCHEEAIASFDKALQIKPDDHQVWNNRAATLGNIGRNEEAITSFEKALQIKPDEYQAWNNRGMALVNTGRNEEAITSFNKALQINPNNYQVWNNRAVALGELGRNEEALASFDNALQIRSDYWQAWGGRGLALDQLNRHKEAIISCDKALEINPDFEPLKSLRSRILSDLKNWPENYKMLETLLNKQKPIHSGLLEKAVQSLFITIPDPQQWQQKIVQLVNRLEERSLLPELVVALVKTASELTSELVSLAKATAWRDAWAEVVGHKPEFDLPLRLLNTALHYKQTPEDPRVFLELPTEERKILQQALGIEHEVI
ncbi:tetratricopeptide repeat protein [Altericista sp. CCNU0014]|uniref:tetratricopeptide repeat protein n=1 Tax=Altericista sp. CCNU0014 TaxID=3082949 RepID=UPI00384E4FED